MKIGIATIGQSPRDDVVPDMFPRIASDDIFQAGALDMLSPMQIQDLAPKHGEHPLVTRLRSGEEVHIAKERLELLMQEAVDKLERDGAAVVCVLCTGEFTLDSVRSRLVYPDRLLAGIVNGLLHQGTIGVVIPHEGQTPWMRRRWTTDCRNVHTTVFSPYGDVRSVEDVGIELSQSDVDLVVLDCMGYPVALRDALIQQIGTPVVHANSAVGAVLTSVLGG